MIGELLFQIDGESNIMELAQVFANRVDNAIKYILKDDYIQCAAYSEAGFTRTQIHDSQAKIPTELLSRIIKRFNKIEVSRKISPKTQTGLNPVIARQIDLTQARSIYHSSPAGEGFLFEGLIPGMNPDSRAVIRVKKEQL